MVTASADIIDRVVGLELGADDYICQAVRPAGASRPGAAACCGEWNRNQPTTPAPATMAHEIRMGRCMFNTQSGRLYTLTGEDVPLTGMEFELLKAFAARPNRVLEPRSVARSCP